MTDPRSVTAAASDAKSSAPPQQHTLSTQAGTPPSTPPEAMTWQNRLRQSPASLRVHILGIGGTGVGPIARVLLQLGVQVSGSDRQIGPATAALATLGAHIYPTQAAANLLDATVATRPHLVLISSAVAPENPERTAAAQLDIPIVKRVDFLPELLANRQTIAIAGTHGKTTTTGMVAHVLQQCGLQPGYIIGAEVPGLGNAAAGTSPWFVIEADEYDHMFLGLYPTLAVVTNVEWDHPDCFPTAASFTDAFRRFLGQVQPHGQIISCHDDEGAEALRAAHLARADFNRPDFNQSWITYGTHPATSHIAASHTLVATAATIQARPSPDGAVQVTVSGEPVGHMQLAVPGLHNVRNALAALAVAQACGIAPAAALTALASYRGSRRRFELIGEAPQGITVIDDYGHHPTEVAATLAAARSRYPDRVIHAVFQPHTFSRTRQYLDAMAMSFSNADHALITDIYPAREQDDGTVHARQIVARAHHPHMEYTGTLDATTARLLATVQPGAVVITLSAGDGNQVGQRLLAHLAAHTPEQDGAQ
ncbi:MAG: UDP-N-acetylmuramate--L-alanine ligase [Litorilinea sp.]